MDEQSIYLRINNAKSDFLETLKIRSGIDIINDPTGADLYSDMFTSTSKGHSLKKKATHLLYIITPDVEDYNIFSELIDDSNKHTYKTSFFFLESDGSKSFVKHQSKSLKATGEMVETNGGYWIRNESDLYHHLQSRPKPTNLPSTPDQNKKKRKVSKKTRVFLGGTVNGSSWRDTMIKQLKVDFFNPVVEEWTDEAQKTELLERKNCDYNLYLITPLMLGYYSLAEVIDDSFRKPGQALYCFLNTDFENIEGSKEEKKFTKNQIRSLRNIGRAVENNGGIWCKSMTEVITFFNKVHENSDYYSSYTTFLEKAVLWSHNQRDINLLMKGFDLVDASNWIQQTQHEDVLPPTQLIHDFYEASDAESYGSNRNSVFISYSRRASLEYATQLYDQLEQNDVNVWFDKKRIRTGVDFRDEIQVGIEKAGNFLFLLSPESCSSPYCQEELQMALKYGKRIIPILHRMVNDNDVAPEIRSFHREEFNQELIEQEGEQHRILQKILKSIESGKQLVVDHTLLLNRALDWQRAGKHDKFLLKSTEQVNAHLWLTQCFNSDVPFQATPLHAEFICESKRHADNDFTDIWLSVQKKDDYSSSVQYVLQKHGLTTSWEHFELGESSEIKIIKATRLIFVITPASLNDKKCLAEIDIARRHSIPIIPLIAEYIEIDELFSHDEKLLAQDFSNASTLVEFTALIENFVTSDFLDDIEYYSQLKYIRHKHFQWSNSQNKLPFLIRGTALKEYNDWLKTYGNEANVPKEKISEYLQACDKDPNINSTEIYLSYHHEMEHFAFRLNEQLNDYGKVTWNDHTDRGASIALSKDYHALGINSSDNLIILASDLYFTADATVEESKLIRDTSKRTILITERSGIEIPESFSSYTVVDFSQDFELACTKLLNELNTDHEYVKQYSHFLGLARTWETAERANSKLILEADEVRAATSWLKDSATKSPKPNELLQGFIDSSVQEQERKIRQAKWRSRLLIFITILAIISTIYSFYQQQEAKSSSIEAKRQADIAKENAIEASHQKEEARKNAENAIIQQKKAEKERQRASLKAEEAETNRKIAETNRSISEENARIAIENGLAADNARESANEKAEEAERERKKAEKSDSTNSVLEKIERGKAMALSTQKLMTSDPDSATNAALEAYEILEPYLNVNRTTGPILFDALSDVYEESIHDGTLKTHLIDGQALVGFEKQDSLIFALSENGSLTVASVNHQKKWSTKSTSFENASTCIISGNSLIVGDRYGQIDQLKWDIPSSQDTLKTSLSASLQVHEPNTNISSIQTVSFNRKDAWFTSGYDGFVHLISSNSGELNIIASYKIGNKILAMDVDLSSRRLAIGTQDSGSYILQYADVESIGQPKIFEYRRVPEPTNITSIRFGQDSQSVLLGLKNGALRLWNLEDVSTIPIEQIKEHNMAITSIEIAPSLIITGSRDGTIKIRHWENTGYNRKPSYIYTYRRHRRHSSTAEILKVLFDKKTRQAYSSDRNRVKKWDIDIAPLYKKVKS